MRDNVSEINTFNFEVSFGSLIIKGNNQQWKVKQVVASTPNDCNNNLTLLVKVYLIIGLRPGILDHYILRKYYEN